MICPFCETNDDRVVDSRASDGGRVIRRRRECLKCSRRFTTYERVEVSGRLVVVKRDGSRVPFNRENILKGVVAACGKRPIAETEKDRVVNEIDEAVHHEFEREVPSREIGRLVMAKLKDLDEVAYIRFASEYHRFNDTGELIEQLEELQARQKDSPDQQKLF